MAVKGKNKKSRAVLRVLFTVVAVLLALCYIGYQVYIIVSPAVKTQTVYKSREYQTISTQVYVIRKETEIIGASSGVMVPAVTNGSRVAKDDTVAYVFEDSASAERYAKSLEIQQEIDRCEGFSDNNAALTDVERLDEEVDSNFLQYLDALDSGDYTAACDLAGEFNDTLTRFKIATGETIDFTQKKAELQKQLETLKGEIKQLSTITASGAGYYVSSTDNYEHKIDYDQALNLTVEQVEQALDTSTPPSEIEGSMGKLIQDFDWYLACVVNVNQIADFEVGDTVRVSLPNAVSEPIDTTVAALNNEPDGRAALILKCNQMSEQLATLRIEDAEIILAEYEGLKIPSAAVRTNEKGEKGVYVLKGNIALFKKIDILYSTEDYVIVSLNSENNEVKIYEQVITEGKDISDGKVIR